MFISGALIGGLRAISHLAHGYCPTGWGKAVSNVDADTGGLCSMITGAVDTIVAKVEDSLRCVPPAYDVCCSSEAD